MTATSPALRPRSAPTAPSPFAAAADLANYRRRLGTRVIVLLGGFDRLIPPDVLKILRSTGADDSLIAAVEAEPPAVVHALADRFRLAALVAEYAVAFAGAPDALIAAIRPGLVIDLRGPAEVAPATASA